MDQLSPAALKTWLDDPDRARPVLVDVREAWELEQCVLPNVVHIAMNTIPSRASELDPNADIVVICHHGGRSAQVGMFLERQGFNKIHNLQGGMNGWSLQVDPTVARY